MGAERFDSLTRTLAAKSVSRRWTLKGLALGGLGALGAGIFADDAEAHKKRKKPCRNKNWCVDRTHTCGPEGGFGKCLIKAFGGNICAEVLFQTSDCADCEEPNCSDCRCVLAAGGGDRCNNGINGFDFICVRKVA